jgi:ATP-dependent helicase/nuclease subunit B
LAGLAASNETTLVAAAPALTATLASSASELALYAQCPFKHFAACRLELQAGPAERPGPLELGQAFHELLDLFTRRLLAEELSLCDLDDAEIERRLALASAELCDRTAPGPDGADEFSWLAGRAVGELGTALAVQRDQQRAGLCRTAASELWFGGKDAVILESPKGRRLELRGRIDRLDLAGTAAFVFDYKSSAGVKVSLPEMYHGWNIQLLVYLLAASGLNMKGQDRPLQPAGAFFLPLSPAPLDVEHPDQAENSRLKAYQPRGLFDARFIAELDQAAGASGSRIVGYKLSQGRPSRRTGSDAWSAEELQALLDHIRTRLGEMADAILDGDVRVAPCRLGSRLACEQCLFGPVCRVDPADNDIRRLQKISRQQFNPRSVDDG